MTMMTLSSVLLFSALGVWQLNRAELKRTVLNQFEARLEADFVDFDEIDPEADNQYRRVILNGRYDGLRTIFLDNQLSGVFLQRCKRNSWFIANDAE